MSTPSRPAAPRRSAFPLSPTALGVLLLAFVASGLITYKAGAALATISQVQRDRTLAAKSGMIPIEDLPGWSSALAASLNYFAWVLVALLFGVVLGALVKAFIPERWLARSIGGRGPRGLLFAALMGAPLMLCSCCVTPIFESIFQRTRRLAPALALMFAAPSLNPAALLLTFLLFPTTIAVGRLGLAFGLVFLVSAGLGLLLGKSAEANETACAVPGTPLRHGGMTHVFLAALWESSRRTLPAIALGVLASAMLAELLPIDAFGSGISGSLMPILIVAAIAVPLALPTFGEIPIALALHAAGAPDGVVLVVLVAGPAINAPSLTILARRISVRAAAITACAVFLIAVAGGSALGV